MNCSSNPKSTHNSEGRKFAQEHYHWFLSNIATELANVPGVAEELDQAMGVLATFSVPQLMAMQSLCIMCVADTMFSDKPTLYKSEPNAKS